MEQTDEELLAKFAALHTAGGGEEPINLTEEEATTRDWTKCALIRVVTDKMVIEQQFAATMRKA